MKRSCATFGLCAALVVASASSILDTQSLTQQLDLDLDANTHKIDRLPGFDGSFPSQHYAGYISVSEKRLFYYLVHSQVGLVLIHS